MNKIIIVVDLGHFKAYAITKETGASARLELLESQDLLAAHGKLSDKVSDRAGNFGEGVGMNMAATGYGEPHSLATENEKRLIKLIAKNINRLIAKENCAKWHLTAGKAINSHIVDNLTAEVKAKLGKNITLNLTKTGKAKILSYFE